MHRQGILIDETTHQLLGQSRLANELEAPLRMQVCLTLGLNRAALANEGFVIYAPESQALLAALTHVYPPPLSDERSAQWTFISNRADTVDTLMSVGAVGQLVEPTIATGFRYHGFFPASPT